MSKRTPLPDGWRLMRLRYLADIWNSNVDKKIHEGDYLVRLCNYTDVYHNDYIRSDMELMEATATEREIDRFSLESGDVIITKDSENWRDIGIPACVAEDLADVVCGYHLTMLRPKSGVYGPFLLRALRAPGVVRQLHLAARGITRFGLSLGGIKDLVIAVPPFEEQRDIAAYLDRETARIDALIAAKRELVERIGEKRQAVVMRAVRRGLDRSVPCRHSGVPWLGEIPAHWEVRRIGTLFEEIDSRGEPDLPLLTVSLNTGVSLREFSEEKIERVASDFSTYKVVRAGEFAFNKMRMWQGAVGVAPEDGLISPDYVVARPTAALDVQYFEYLFRSPAMSAEFARHSYGIVWDRLRLYWDGFKSIRIPFPPVTEQRSIAAEINRLLAAINAVAFETQYSINVLRQRREALIAATVTGKRRVL